MTMPCIIVQRQAVKFYLQPHHTPARLNLMSPELMGLWAFGAQRPPGNDGLAMSASPHLRIVHKQVHRRKA